MLRSIVGSTLYFLFLLIWTPLYATGVVLMAPLLSLDMRWKLCAYWLTSTVYVLKWLCGVNWVVEGQEHLPSGGAIVLSKHQSTWETFAIPAILYPRRLCYVYKKELMYIPFFGWCMALLNMIPINRTNPAQLSKKYATWAVNA